jgi:hypothetical protein
MFRRSIQVVTSKAVATATRIVPKSQQFHSLLSNKSAKGSISYLTSIVKRELSTNEKPTEEQPKEEKVHNEVVKLDYDEYDDYEPKTAGQKVRIKMNSTCHNSHGFRKGGILRNNLHQTRFTVARPCLHIRDRKRVISW